MGALFSASRAGAFSWSFEFGIGIAWAFHTPLIHKGFFFFLICCHSRGVEVFGMRCLEVPEDPDPSGLGFMFRFFFSGVYHHI